VTFAHPAALLALIAAPLAILLLAYAARERRAALAAFAAAGHEGLARRQARRRRWRGLFTVAALALLAVALAGPRYGTGFEEISQEGVDLVIALDVSRSMLVEDVAPNRLQRAQVEIDRMLDELAGSRVGLVIFAAEALALVPLTTDIGAVRQALAVAHPDLVPAQGTDFAEALRHAAHAFEVGAGGGSDGEPRARVILLVSDGEDHPDRYAAPLRAAEDGGIVVMAAGVGTPDGGPIPIRRPGEPARFLADREGQNVVSRFDGDALRRIGRSGGYFGLDRPGASLGAVPAALAQLDRSVLRTDRFATFAERFQWPLGLALAFLMAERALALRRLRP
jgi:Ca-activated chloride channel homolog